MKKKESKYQFLMLFEVCAIQLVLIVNNDIPTVEGFVCSGKLPQDTDRLNIP